MQNAAVVAYGEATKTTESPRDREAALLIKAAADLQKIKDNADCGRDEVRRALNFNRKIWTVFVTSIARDDNPLPQEIKNNIGSIGVFVLGQTTDALINAAPEKLAPLISINQNIAAGLRGQT